MARLGVGLSLCFLVASFSTTAQNPPQSDPEALKWAALSVAAMTGGNPVSDATLTGDVTWFAGSDKEIGTATLLAKGTVESRVDLSLDGGTRTDIRNDTGPYPQGVSQVKGGDQQTWALHNCYINASWFFPALSFLNATSDPGLIFSYIGEESRGGVKVEHLQVYRYLGGNKPITISIAQRASTADYYLDSSSLLPVAITFNTHADDDAYTDVSLEIDFSDYKVLDGVQVPFHIQRFVFAGLALDVVVQSAALNSGLSDDLFAVQ